MQEEHLVKTTLIFLVAKPQHHVNCCSKKIKKPTRMHPTMYKITCVYDILVEAMYSFEDTLGGSNPSTRSAMLLDESKNGFDNIRYPKGMCTITV